MHQHRVVVICFPGELELELPERLYEKLRLKIEIQCIDGIRCALRDNHPDISERLWRDLAHWIDNRQQLLMRLHRDVN